METTWDYTDLAAAYLKRPDYSKEAVERILKTAGVKPHDRVCDVGAGVAHLTLHLLAADLKVYAVEPNDSMRQFGMERTKTFKNVVWSEGTGEQTNQPEKFFQLVTFGSSFNVTDRAASLVEASRVLCPGGWFACLWNHRKLEDPIQTGIQSTIEKHLPGYSHGIRREDQTEVIRESRLYKDVVYFEGTIVHRQAISDCLEAWESHATLRRQAGQKFATIVEDIGRHLKGLGVEEIDIPYTTRVWMAQVKTG